MSHIGCKDDEWANADLYASPEDSFLCEACDIGFSLESSKIKGKKIICPVCQKSLTAWRKNSR
jgi:uncharacterized paraquat-inducible protein A